ncbi:MAG: hypothetical protein N4A72_21885 [Bacteroidales bacterium]|jgi:hypothetical protein|nr:hypothetical protein [Bacteroidales bacterium]
MSIDIEFFYKQKPLKYSGSMWSLKSKLKRIKFIYLYISGLLILFGCNSEQKHVDDSFQNRVEPILNGEVYPVLFPFETDKCEGYELLISSSISLKDTLYGTLTLLDSLGIKMPFYIDGGSWNNNIGISNKEIAIYPKPVAFSVWYIIMKNREKLHRINLLTKDGKEIILYEKGDSLGVRKLSSILLSE